MKIKIIKHPDELNTCNTFSVDCLLWGTRKIPRTYGRIGFVPEEGFYLSMTCEESSPRRTYTESNSPVYRDSAMEVFFCFAPGGVFSDIYTNFEMNANGALLAMYGASRDCRTAFPPDGISQCNCRATVRENDWRLSLFIPLSILEEIYGNLSLEAGSYFSLNFYKLSESSDIEHYASFSPVHAPVPDFHLPQFFERAELVRASE